MVDEGPKYDENGDLVEVDPAEIEAKKTKEEDRLRKLEVCTPPPHTAAIYST